MRVFNIIICLASCVVLSSCSSTALVSAAGKVAGIALEATGLKKPEVPEIPDLQKPPRNVSLKLHAGENLNAGSADKSLSLVAKIYKLKQTEAFYAAPYDAFLSPEKEKQALGTDLLEVREISLVPGQLYEVIEKVSRESSYIGVVTLFRTPAPQRWRAAFASKDAETSGITLGIHACSVTLGKGVASDQARLTALTGNPARCL
jgi:type VI secretion system protein VasD